MESYIPMHDALLQKTLEIYSAPELNSPIAFADALMDTESLAMHCPEHHFIVPAALLLAAHRKDGHDAATLEKDLKTALTRAKSSLPSAALFCSIKQTLPRPIKSALQRKKFTR